MIKRAPVKWFGGKGVTKKRILPLIPYSKIFVDVYGGAGNILLARDPSPVEVYNDLDNSLVTLMRVLQHPERMMALHKQLTHTLYSREEFRTAIEILKSKTSTRDEIAWAVFVAQNQGFGGVPPKNVGSWGRSFTATGKKSKKTSAWMSLIDLLPDWHHRLMCVQIDSRDAIDAIKYWDTPETTFYLDPPYVADSRKSKNIYNVEADDEHHANLVQTILQCQGAVVLSGYPNEIYKPLEDAGWERREFQTSCAAVGRIRGSSYQGTVSVKGRQPRTEVIWRNHKAVELCPAP